MTENNTDIDIITMESFAISEAQINIVSSSPHLYSDYKGPTTDSEDKTPNTAESISNGDSEGKLRDPSPQRSTTKNKKLFGKEGAKNRYKLWLRFEQVGLAVVIIIIWGLFALPIIFYHLPVVSYH